MNQNHLLSSVAHGLVLLGLALGTVSAQTTNTITSPGFNQYSVNGVAGNPTITMQAGFTHVLNINVTPGFHNVLIQTAPNLLVANRYSGATPQQVALGPINVTIPSVGFPTTLYYICFFHGFFGMINVTPPSSPPPTRNTILSLSLTPSNVVMKSTGTNTTWLFVPEFSSNLMTWATVPGFSNNFASGTNTTTFNRLDPICGPNVYLRVRQSSP